jgi:hypothetical protein
MATRYVYREPQEERPLGELLSQLGSEVQLLLRKELELAKVEVKEQATRAGKAGAMFGGAAVAGFLGLLLLAFAAGMGPRRGDPDGAGIPSCRAALPGVRRLVGDAGPQADRGFQPRAEQDTPDPE